MASKIPIEIGRLTRLDMGYVGESDSREHLIDVTEWLKKWPDATIAVYVQQPDGRRYTPAVDVEDGILRWVVTAGETTVAGRGMANIRAIDFATSMIYKSRTVQTIIDPSIGEELDPEAPDPMDTWVVHAMGAADTAAKAKAEAVEAAEAAEKSASAAEAAASGTGAAAEQAQQDAQRAEAAADAAEETVQAAADKAAQDAADVVLEQVGLLAPAIVAEASGMVASMTDAAARNAVQLQTIISTSAAVTSVTLKRTGSNLLDIATCAIAHSSTSSNPAYNVERTETGAKVTTLRDLSANAGRIMLMIGKREELAGQTLTLTCDYSCTQEHAGNHLAMRFCTANDADGGYVSSGVTSFTSTGYDVCTGVVPDTGGTYVYAWLYLGYYGSNGFTAPAGTVVEWSNVRVNIGETALDFAPYSSQTLTATVPSVTEGVLNWTEGTLTTSEGTTQLDKQDLMLDKGANSLRSSAGETYVRYIADTQLYIDGRSVGSAPAPTYTEAEGVSF